MAGEIFSVTTIVLKKYFSKKRLSEGPNFFLCKIGQNGKMIQKNMIIARTTAQQKDLINALMEFF